MAEAIMNTTSKFCFYAMYKNESKSVIKSLESVYRYIDYWVIQDNGSTDGTQDLIRDFFKEKNIPGFLYQLDWWKGAGANAEHLVRTAMEADHGCDWLLRIDADEILVVDDDFDWTEFNHTHVDSWLLPAEQDNYRYLRVRILNAHRDWRFNPEKAHETPYIEGRGDDYDRIKLPWGIKNKVTKDGFSYTKPMKYLVDALTFEADLIPSHRIKENNYHLWYTAKSYMDTYRFDKWNYPYPQEMTNEFARRTIFYFQLYLKQVHGFPNYQIDHREVELGYLACLHTGRAFDWLGEEDTAFKYYEDCLLFCPERNEHNVEKLAFFWRKNNWLMINEISDYMIREENKFPYPKYDFLLDIEAYSNSSCKSLLWKVRALYNLGRYHEIPYFVQQMEKFEDYNETDVQEINEILENIKN